MSIPVLQINATSLAAIWGTNDEPSCKGSVGRRSVRDRFNFYRGTCTAPINKHPAKAKSTTPLQQSAVVATFTNSSALAVVPKKPVVVTAVAPKGPIPSDNHAIIFVGGKTQRGGDSALNPQPIPPGHIAPGDPVR